ncbi:hypothetical protein D0Z07_1301 [Hyphodiscus hymeniophilus]|uniref:L-ornithine N(5)-monooxygenase [NAD(P)H] n=1 Tax=Hyphodiscus hymeniophilus TaxID=353542 RepID=A0A9P7B0F2_9HELO|nr:hypothetical protein D0Z07_1301 [Hyphodiscus hymeniophilus]
MDEDIHIHDIIVIGAGPCGLALAARLREHTPSALFTDSEHQRYHWMKASTTSKRTKPVRTSRRSRTDRDRLLQGPSPSKSTIDMAVLDAQSSTWMSSWNSKFSNLRISHLRSPMFFHPDPSDRDGLLSFTYREAREKELREIQGVVGKSLSKHQRKQQMKRKGSVNQETSYLDERDRNDYFRPSQSLFKKYCEEVASRYGLSDLVEEAEVSSISYEPSLVDKDSGIFTLKTSAGMKRARIVVMAVGAALKPKLPPDCPFCGLEQTGSVTHAFMRPNSSPSLSKQGNTLPPHVLRKIAAKKPTNIIVVGGGLTSAQITDTALSSGVTKVYHLMRGRMKVKHFDVDLPWVGKYKNYHLATFWSADDDEERFEMVRDARGGGSITPEYRKILQGHEAGGRVDICTETEIVGARWIEEKQCWEVKTRPEIEMPGIDHVVYATGLQVDFKGIPALQPLLGEQDVRCIGGMPCLTDDLMLSEDVPLFVTGRLASLRLGPGAGNLEGARMGAERIAWKVGELLRDWDKLSPGLDITENADSGYGSTGSGEEEVDSRRMGLGIENQFAVLGREDDEEDS